MYSFPKIDYNFINNINTSLNKIRNIEEVKEKRDVRLENMHNHEEDLTFSYLCNQNKGPFSSKEYQIADDRKMIELIYNTKTQSLPHGTFTCWLCTRSFKDAVIWFYPKNYQKVNSEGSFNYYGEGMFCSWYCSYIYGTYNYGKEGADKSSKFFKLLTGIYPLVENKIVFSSLIKYGGTVSYEELDREIIKYQVDFLDNAEEKSDEDTDFEDDDIEDMDEDDESYDELDADYYGDDEED